MNIACAKRSHRCFCDGSEQGNPLANLTSEAPDKEVFISNRHYEYPDIPNIICLRDTPEDLANCPPFPPDCDLSTNITCPHVCAQGCSPKPNSCDPPSACPPHGCTPSSPCPPCNCPVTVYYNRESSCTICGFTYTVPAGVVSSTVSQADADARAQSECEYRACHGPEGPHRRPATPGVKCPVITGYFPTPPVSAHSGDTVVLSVLYTYEGTGPLTFNWLKDGTPFTSTPGASLTFAPATSSDTGFYTLIIQAPGCSPVVSQDIQLIVTIADCTGVAVPSTFMIADNTIMETTGIGLTFHESVLSPGKFRIKYVSGNYEICNYTNLDCSGPLTGAFTLLPASIVAEQWFNLTSSWIPLFGFTEEGQSAGYPFCPANKESEALSAFLGLSPDRWLVDAGLNPREWVLDDTGLTDLYKVRTHEAFETTACNGSGQSLTGGCTNNIIRVGKFIPEPYSVSIIDFATFMASIKPVTADGPNCFPVWDGVISETFHMGEVIFEITNTTEKCFQNLHITFVELTVNPGVQWNIRIFGFWSELGVDQPEELLWQGKKTCGTTPIGIYSKTSSFVVGAADTLVLE